MAKTFKRKRRTRAEKVSCSFQEAAPLRPRNMLQRAYMEAIENYPVVLASGFPGTGKTYIPARIAAQQLKQGRIQNITLVRPAVSASTSLGFFKGSKDEKMRQWLAPVLGALREEFAPGQMQYLMKEDVGSVSFCPLEVVKGMSWRDSFVIVDEVEDCTLKELQAIITRIGVNTTIVLCGDEGQTDLPHTGILELQKLIQEDKQMQSVVHHIAFDDVNAIVRSPACKQAVVGFDRYYRRKRSEQ